MQFKAHNETYEIFRDQNRFTNCF